MTNRGRPQVPRVGTSERAAAALIGSLLEPPDRRSIGRANDVVEDVLAEPRLLAAVISALDDEPAVVRIRAADVVEKVSRVRPELLHPYIEPVLTLAATTTEIELRWHAAQVFGRMPLTAAQRRRAVSVLLGYLDDASSIVRTCAMQALTDLAANDQELSARIVPLLERLTISGTPAMRARGRMLLRRLVAEGG